jgi:hypothetical protein
VRLQTLHCTSTRTALCSLITVCVSYNSLLRQKFILLWGKEKNIKKIICLILFFAVLGIEPRASHMSGKHATIEFHCQPKKYF